jgi:excisionase family DNA binding protein
MVTLGEERYLRVKDVGEILGFGLNKTYDIVRLRGFPKVRIGRSYLIPLSLFSDWMKSSYGTEVRIK